MNISGGNRTSSNSLLCFQNSAEWIDAVVRSSNDAIIGTNLNGTIVSWNIAAKKIYGYSADEIIGKTIAVLLPKDREDEFQKIIDKIKRGEKIENYETIRIHKNRTLFYVSITISPITDGSGTIIGSSIIARDITKMKKMQQELMKKNEEMEKSYPRLKLAEQLFENVSDGIVVTDAQGVVQMVNPAFTRITGYTYDELYGLTLRILKSGRHEEDFYKDMWEKLQIEGKWAGEIWNKKKNGEIYLDWISINSIYNTGTVFMYAGIYRDLTERKKYEEELQYQAFHDALTGLPNRLLFQQKLETMLTFAKRNNQTLATCFLDLDGFKKINDTLGHDMGDCLLQEVAKRLTMMVRVNDTVARMGGDEFTIILSEFKNEEKVGTVAEKIIEAIGKPYNLAGNIVKITTSIGISLYPKCGQDVQTLMKQADSAMYNAKNSGKNKYAFYEAELK